MSIVVQCDACGMKRNVNERLAGRTIRCPGCEQPLLIPASAASVEAEPMAEAGPMAEPELIAEAGPAGEVADALSTIDDETASVEAARGLRPDSVPSAVASVQQAAISNNGDQRGGSAATTVLKAPPSRLPAAAPVAPEARQDEDLDEAVPPRKKRDDGELDMTPMVDVTFLLLIFFMVTASFSLQKSIQMPRQSSDLPSMSNVEEETDELDPIELEIDETGAFLVLAAEWERETPGKQNLITALKQAIGDNRDGMRLDVKVHENAKLQMLVDGMDAGTIAGFTQIQVTEVDGFD